MDQVVASSKTTKNLGLQDAKRSLSLKSGESKENHYKRKNNDSSSDGRPALTSTKKNGVFNSISSGLPIWIPFLIAISSFHPVSSYSWNANRGSCLSNWNRQGSPTGFSPRPFSKRITTSRLQSLVDENNFDTASSTIKKQQHISTKKGKEATVEFKDFWGSAITSVDKEERPPYVPTLDPFWGSLPKAAYQCEAEEIWDPKPTCLIAIDLRSTIATKSDNSVQMVQHYLESGFQTFHVGSNPQFAADFHAQTPTKLIGKDSIHWVLNYPVPTKVQSLQSIRQDILDNLLDPMSSSCTDAIDTLVVQYNPKSPYHMDVLYVLNELQEEGFIRSIGLQDFPQKLVAKAVVECGFVVNLVQQPGSLLIPPDASNLVPPIQHQWTTNPFLDGLLLLGAAAEGIEDGSSSKRLKKTAKKTMIQATSRKQRKSWDSTLHQWAKLHGVVAMDEDGKEFIDSVQVSETFETEVMHVLNDMAWRYGVPRKSLILRWAMESFEPTSSVVIPAPTGDMWNDMEDFASSRPWRGHIQELRQAFTFRIEEPDKALLAEMSKGPEPEEDQGMVMMDLGELEEFLVQQGLPENEIEALLMEQEQQQADSSTSSTGYPKIELDNPKLWL